MRIIACLINLYISVLFFPVSFQIQDNRKTKIFVYDQSIQKKLEISLLFLLEILCILSSSSFLTCLFINQLRSMLKTDFVFFFSSSSHFFCSHIHHINLCRIVFLSSSPASYASIVSSKKGLLSLFSFTFRTKMHKKATRKETKMHAALILPACIFYAYTL